MYFGHDPLMMLIIFIVFLVILIIISAVTSRSNTSSSSSSSSNSLTSQKYSRFQVLSYQPTFVDSDSQELVTTSSSSDPQSVNGNANGANLVSDTDFLANSLTIQTRTFPMSTCAVQDGGTNSGKRRVLSFGTRIVNAGDQDLVMGNEKTNTENFVYLSCSRKYAVKDLVNYVILDESTNLHVAGPFSRSLILQDSKRAFQVVNGKGTLESKKFTEKKQGLATGWCAIYPKHSDSQWIDVTDLQPGNYVLRTIVQTPVTHSNAWLRTHSSDILFVLPPR